MLFKYCCDTVLVLVLVVAGVLGFTTIAGGSVSLIPKPVSVEWQQGSFLLEDGAFVVYDGYGCCPCRYFLWWADIASVVAAGDLCQESSGCCVEYAVLSD